MKLIVLTHVDTGNDTLVNSLPSASIYVNCVDADRSSDPVISF